MLTAISPVDGRYARKTEALQDYFSEYALIKYRVYVEIEYFKALVALPLPQLEGISPAQLAALDEIFDSFDETGAERIKGIERTTNHDVKAVEYYLKTRFDVIGLGEYKEFIHFGLTSQDINNTATPLLIQDALEAVYIPALDEIIEQLEQFASAWFAVPMLARTHGQPASPTLLGKEFQVFVERLQTQLEQLEEINLKAKFGGATGNFNAHYVAYPGIDWHAFGTDFVEDVLELERAQVTTQIEHYDSLAQLFHTMERVHTILIDLCRDCWTYISMDYFKQRTVQGEVGSSAMPHKVNPIDFENAEGNLGLANALLHHLAGKLPISRLQRDLTDSTVLRNVGVPFGHALIAFQSCLKGCGKLLLNEAKLREDLEANWTVVAEALQNILRREGYPNPYETLKALTRGKASITSADLHQFVDQLPVDERIKAEMRRITPWNYVGKANYQPKND